MSRCVCPGLCLGLGLGLLAVAAALRPSLAQAGAFNRASGEGLAIYASGFSQFGHFVDGRGRERRQPQATKFESSVLVEYGLAEWLTALVKPGFVILRDSASFAPAISGGGALGLQVQAWKQDGIAVALQASARFARGDTGLAGTGEERAGLELRALAGGNVAVGRARIYVEGQAAYRVRRGEADEVLLDATLILPLSEKTDLLAQVFSRFRHAMPQQPREAAHKAGLTLMRRLSDRWSLSAGLFTTLHVRNARREHGATLGLHRRF